MPKLKEKFDPQEYAVLIAHAHQRAREIAVDVFGEEKPSRETINGVYDRVIYLKDSGELIEESIAKSVDELIDARVWAKEVYGEDGPAATFDAFDKAFDLDE